MSDPRATTTTYPVRSNCNAIEWAYDRTRHGSNEGLIREVTMNAMPVVAMPGGSEVRPRQAPRPRRAPGPGRASGVGRAPSLGPAPDARLRLTRRGRVVAAAMAALA